MLKSSKFVGAILVLLAFVSFVGCSKKDAASEKKYTGTFAEAEELIDELKAINISSMSLEDAYNAITKKTVEIEQSVEKTVMAEAERIEKLSPEKQEKEMKKVEEEYNKIEEKLIEVSEGLEEKLYELM